MKNKIKSRFVKSVIIYMALIIILNIAGRFKGFCDFYTDYIFRWCGGLYSHVTGIFPFSVGEILIPVAALIVIVAFIMLLVLIFIRKNEKELKLKKYIVIYCKCTLILILTVALFMTLNCSIPYNCSKLDIDGNGNKVYMPEQIKELRNYIVINCIELSSQMDRDEDGNVVYGEYVYNDVKDALHSIDAEFPRLKGYYPNPKKIMNSYMMYQAGLSGIYFPFTMEANYNSYISATSQPQTVAHELCHLKGYMYENEADFIACVACIGSDDLLVKYSGYLSALGFIDSDYFWAVPDEEYFEQIEIPDVVWNDYYSYTSQVAEKLKQIEEDGNSLFDTQTISEANDVFTEAYMEYYNVEPNYSEMTKLLLQYYDGVLY